jgi:hypothetical protein
VTTIRHPRTRRAAGAALIALLCVGVTTACSGATADDVGAVVAVPAPQLVPFSGGPVTVAVPQGVGSVVITARAGAAVRA